ncbi:T9SS type A sorting domain-containing protein, partial [candidate division KSB1 bacterium]|nr:T9SS type A sorting domain-containing protein [candidate division KSB1 bacterium]
TVTVKFSLPNTDQYIVRINCGSSLDYRDKSGKLWQADKPYAKDSWGYIGGSTFSTSDPIANTEEDVLYQSERWDMSGYNFDVQNGFYEVTLLFAEIYFRESGSRVFNVYLEEKEVLHHFDIFAAVGHDYATSRTFIAEVDDNQLNIKFGKVVEDWKLAAVKVVQKKTQTQDQVAESFILYQNYPNPFKLSTSMAFDLPYSSSLKIDIYNVLGQKIKSDIFGPFSEGYQQFTWQAIDASGKMLPSGMYFYKIKMLEQQKSTIQYKKMIIKK